MSSSSGEQVSDDHNNMSDDEEASSNDDDGGLSDVSNDQDATRQTQLEPDSLEDDDDNDSFDEGSDEGRIVVDEDVGVRWDTFSRIEQSPTH